jgi:hypothetical protein
MARTTILAEYRTAGGATLTVQTTSGFFTYYTVTADCGGCRGGITRESNGYSVTCEDADAAVKDWASEHAVTCHRIPSSS